MSVFTHAFLLLSGTTTGKCKELQQETTAHLLHSIESNTLLVLPNRNQSSFLTPDCYEQ